MKRTLGQIVKATAEHPNLQAEWDRQLQTAIRISECHEAGLSTILLADEVGMGKTYVALASISNHIFQTDKNNRKALLVVPPNNILARKWEQEIRTFNDKYLQNSIRKTMNKSLRPMVVTDYWDLIKNLHDFENQDTPRVSERMLQCFALSTWKWSVERRRKGTRIRDWVTYGKVTEYDTDYLDFCSWYSPRAIFDFLDEESVASPQAIAEMINHFNTSNPDDGRLKALFKKFGQHQDSFEANVFVIGMGTLRRTKISAEDSKLLCTYIASALLKGYWEDSKRNALKQLVKHGLSTKQEGMADCGAPHLRWFSALGMTNMWGMRETVLAVINLRGDREALVNQIVRGDAMDKLFKQLQDQVISEKLKSSGISLAIVDEVHNWKSGNNGAAEFERRYAPAIRNKLIMSATPFQLHQDELGRVFRASSGKDDQSIAVVNRILEVDGIAQKCLAASDQFLKSWQGLKSRDCQLLSAIDPSRSLSLSEFLELRNHPDTSEQLVLFLDCLMKYESAVGGLKSELSKIVIRHTKNRDKRHFHAGREYTKNGNPNYSKIRRTLYTTSGFGDTTDALMNFIAMRLDLLVRRDMKSTDYETNAHLLGGITSSNEAFCLSNAKLLKNDKVSSSTQKYLSFFGEVLQANVHPKVQVTVERAFSNFKVGRKTLIFCERLGTQSEILAALENRIDTEIFPNGGFDQARKDREAVLREHQSVEFFLSRSFLCALDDESKAIAKNRIAANRTQVLDSVLSLIGELGGDLSQRQIYKLVDLVLLRFASDDGGKTVKLIGNLVDHSLDALKIYLRMREEPEANVIDEVSSENQRQTDELTASVIDEILEGSSIWYARPHPFELHRDIWQLLESEVKQLTGTDLSSDLYILAGILLDLGQGLRKVLLRLDRIRAVSRLTRESITDSIIRMLSVDEDQNNQSSWSRTHEFVKVLIDAEGSLRRKSPRSSKRQSLWKGVFLRDERIASEMNGSTDQEKRINLCAAFNSPLLPDILVCTSIGSEGIDLHMHCADVIHHDLPWNPAKLEQRTGRVDRVGSMAEKNYHKNEFRLNIGIPFLAHNYEQYQYQKLLSRAQRFEILLGKPEFATDVEEETVDDNGKEVVSELSQNVPELHSEDAAALPEWILDYLKMDLSVYRPIEP